MSDTLASSADRNAPGTLGFAKAPAETRVAVAMSGGVDSSVVSAMMKEDGFDVVGLTMQLSHQPRVQ